MKCQTCDGKGKIPYKTIKMIGGKIPMSQTEYRTCTDCNGTGEKDSP